MRKMGALDFRCIHCGFKIKALIVQYSVENIRLIKCDNCKAIADEYVECEIMILVIDLILHEPKAYRHLLYNACGQAASGSKGLLWRSALSFLLLDAYRTLVLKSSAEGWSSATSFSSLVWRYQKILLHVLFGNFIFFSIFLLGTRIMLDTSGGHSRSIRLLLLIVVPFSELFGMEKNKGLILTILISSYLKLFLIALMVWEFPSSVIFIIDMFVMSSNIVALKVVIAQYLFLLAFSSGVMERCIASNNVDS